LAEPGLDPSRFWIVRQADGRSGWWLCTNAADAERFAASEHFEIHECSSLETIAEAQWASGARR
jgi:hypothetical protein